MTISNTFSMLALVLAISHVGISQAALTAVAPVPEPEAYVMMLAGLGLVGWMAVRRRKQIAN